MKPHLAYNYCVNKIFWCNYKRIHCLSQHMTILSQDSLTPKFYTLCDQSFNLSISISISSFCVCVLMLVGICRKCLENMRKC